MGAQAGLRWEYLVLGSGLDVGCTSQVGAPGAPSPALSSEFRSGSPVRSLVEGWSSVIVFMDSFDFELCSWVGLPGEVVVTSDFGSPGVLPHERHLTVAYFSVSIFAA